MSVETLKRVWPEWQIEGKPLGKGSYGVVYKAVRKDHNVQSYAAIKVISVPSDPFEIDSLRTEGLDLSATRTYLQGIVNDFINEIQLMVSLKGIQNIVSVEDYKVVEKVNEIGWDICIRMELLTSFNTYTSDKKLSEKEIIKLGCDICTALEICEKCNIIHRDIKPENIFINNFGYFKLGDFGIARKMENMTGGLSQKGTFNYMAPEVANNSEYDARVDTYSLGIVLYRLLNGNRLPFLDLEKQILSPNERRNAVERRIRGEELPVPREASPAMADIVLRACAYNPKRRFSSAAEMKQALMRVANGTYQMVVCNPDRIASVRRTSDNYDKTIFVSKDSVSNQKSAPTISTFGILSKINSKTITVFVVLIAMIIGGVGFFAMSRLIGNDEKVIISDGILFQIVDRSKFEEKQISFIISEAEALAYEEDYEGALIKIQAGLKSYPKSSDLKNKADEYTELRNIQIKERTILEAEIIANSGDYKAAMDMIEFAQNTYGDNYEYQNAYDKYKESYNSSIKKKAIEDAANLAAKEDYVGAIQMIEDAISIIGEDVELCIRAESYRDSYVAEKVAEADKMIIESKYDEAISIINSALEHVPSNKVLIECKEKIKDLMPKNFIEACAPYEIIANAWHVYTLDGSDIGFVMGGEKYMEGFEVGVSHWNDANALFNLKSLYSELEFKVGHVDGTQMGNAELWVYLDGEIYQKYNVVSDELPIKIVIPVENVSQIKFYIPTVSTMGYMTHVGFADMVIK